MNKIIDGMKKEVGWAKFVTIFGYLLVLATLFKVLFKDDGSFSKYDNISILFYFFAGSFGLYGWIYASVYELVITKEKLHLRTMFKRIEINISDISSYTCKRYGKSVFYKFGLCINSKKITVYTRYKEDFEKIITDKLSK